MAVEDFTTYTEVDPNSHLSKTAYHVDHKAYRNEDCYLYKDKGVDHFGDFTHLIEVTPVTKGSSASSKSEYYWALSNDVNDWNGLQTGNKTGISILLYQSSGAYPVFYMDELYNGTEYLSTPFNGVWGTHYYAKIVKNGTNLTFYVYIDPQRTNLLGSGTLTLHADHKFRYIFAGNTYNNGVNTERWIDVDIDNLDLQEGGAIVKEVVDSLSLSEALLRNRTLGISDSIGLADTSLRDKTFAVADSISLSEIIEVVTGAIIKYVADTIGLAEQIRVDRAFIVSDTMSILDPVFRHRPSVAIMDALVLAEGIAAAKTLAIADQIVLAEVVEKAVAGAVKTRIFLIVGDLAIQIAG